MRNKLSSNPEIIVDELQSSNIMEVFNKLNEKCDVVIEKIKKRKEKTKVKLNGGKK